MAATDSTPELLREPVLAPTAQSLRRHSARMLEPQIAMRLPGQSAPAPTVYVADRLVVGERDEQTYAVLGEAAARFGLRLVRDDYSEPASVVRLEPQYATPAPDAWSVLQAMRELVGADAVRRAGIGLDHLLTAASAPDVGAGVPAYQYATPGAHGRVSVGWIGTGPARAADRYSRRPTVALVDSPIGRHAWLDQRVRRASEPGSGTHHATFTAGIVLQACPDADIVEVPLPTDDGIVAESEVLAALQALLDSQHRAQSYGDGAQVIDIALLPFGFYAEGDDVEASPLADVLAELGRTGVVVVSPAGNDATTLPMYPAALAQTPRPDAAPLISVAASNPDGGPAAFSNDGDWVSCHRRGVMLVSTFPTEAAGPPVRSSYDPSDFSGGFGLWSGTSFAAAALAGELASALDGYDLDVLSADDTVNRARRAAANVLERTRPPQSPVID